MVLTQSTKEKIPDWLTHSRIFLALPVFVLLYFAEDVTEEIYRVIVYWFAFALCVCAGFTDFLDGYLARRWKRKDKKGEIIDRTGAKIDPIADKLFTYPVLLVLAAPTWLIFFMLMRDLFIIFLRYVLEGRQLEQKTSASAKLKTMIMFSFILVAILVSLYLPQVDVWQDWYFTHILFAMTLWTLLHYCRDGIKLFRGNK